ncbi:MAG: methyltransferase domain-containing protein [Zoogloeaceae bacterium]|jgi:malonyl-CoA O-methyltransferase|nr:methyltransferase domain-containing protein [Zoogloeaceae bacterium]
MSVTAEQVIDRAAVHAHFRRAAMSGGSDFLTREIDCRMQERLEYVRLAPARILDLGCGSGPSFSGLQARYPGAHYIGVDLVFADGAIARRGVSGHPAPGKVPEFPTFLAGDATALPLKEQCADLIWANLLFPWLTAPPFFAESLRCLAPGGLLMFSALGPDTLKELRGGFRDGHAHTQAFSDLHDLGDLLLATGFSGPVMDMEILTLTYENLETLVRDLRAAGATCAMRARRRGLAGRAFLETLRTHYERFRREGRLPATFEILYGHAWKPDCPPDCRPGDAPVLRAEFRRIMPERGFP